MKEINELVTKGQAQEDRAKEVLVYYSKEAHVTSRLFANTYVRNQAAHPSYIDLSDGIKVDFFDDSLNIKNTLTARYARWYDQKENVLIRDSVHVINNKGEQLFTQELVWNENLREFYTDKPVKIVTATQVINGTGLEANQDFSWYQISSITGAVKINKATVPE